MKFAAHDGSAARTLASSSSQSLGLPALPAASGSGRRSSSSGVAHAAAGSSPRIVASTGPVATTGGTGAGPGTAAGGAKPSDGRTRQRSSTATYLKGQEIFTPGHGGGLVYIVRSGCLRLYKVLPDGRSINFGLLGPNTIFAQEDGFDGLSTGATAEALIDSSVSVVESDDLAELIAESPDLASAVVTGMTRRLTELQTLIEHLLVRDTSVRLVTTLLALVKSFGRPTADGMVAITLPLTHQGLANMIGSNRVTVTRKLLELQRAGVVRSLGRNAVAVDPDKLRAYAQAAGAIK